MFLDSAYKMLVKLCSFRIKFGFHQDGVNCCHVIIIVQKGGAKISSPVHLFVTFVRSRFVTDYDQNIRFVLQLKTILQNNLMSIRAKHTLQKKKVVHYLLFILSPAKIRWVVRQRKYLLTFLYLTRRCKQTQNSALHLAFYLP